MIPVVLVTAAAMIAALVAVMASAQPWPLRALVVSVFILVTYLLFSVFRNTYYEVGKLDLRIVSGPFKWTIPIAEMRDLSPSRNPLSSPALSIDRLKISYGKRKFIFVSPQDKDGFRRAIEQVRDPQKRS